MVNNEGYRQEDEEKNQPPFSAAAPLKKEENNKNDFEAVLDREKIEDLHYITESYNILKNGKKQQKTKEPSFGGDYFSEKEKDETKKSWEYAIQNRYISSDILSKRVIEGEEEWEWVYWYGDNEDVCFSDKEGTKLIASFLFTHPKSLSRMKNKNK